MKNDKQKVVLIGGGQHAWTLLNVFESQGITVVGYIAPTESLLSEKVSYLGDDHIIGDISIKLQCKFFIALGFYNRTTLLNYVNFYKEYSSLIDLSDPLVHPSAYFSSFSSIKRGTYIGPKALINDNVSIGYSCIINSGAIIEHDCKIGNGCHIAPGAIVCGGTKIGDFSIIGAGSVLLNNLVIERETVVKAGTTVTH